MVYLQCWANGTDVYLLHLSLLSNPLLTEFISAAGAAVWRASGHFDFSFVPVNLGIMFPEPGVSKYQFLFSQASDAEDSLFGMIFVLENETDSFSYRTRFIRRAIYVVDWNRV